MRGEPHFVLVEGTCLPFRQWILCLKTNKLNLYLNLEKNLIKDSKKLIKIIFQNKLCQYEFLLKKNKLKYNV